MTFLPVIRPYENIFIQKYAVRRYTSVTLTVLSSESCAHMLWDHTAQKLLGGKKQVFNLQLCLFPAGFACTASIHSQWEYITQSTCGTEKPTRSIYISKISKLPLIEPWLPGSLWLMLSLFLAHSPCLSPHVWYVKVLFPCPGATYTQGKHRAVCVDDCQPWPFIICQASVLWGGKYTQWIMVVLVCRRNPTTASRRPWQNHLWGNSLSWTW